MFIKSISTSDVYIFPTASPKKKSSVFLATLIVIYLSHVCNLPVYRMLMPNTNDSLDFFRISTLFIHKPVVILG